MKKSLYDGIAPFYRDYSNQKSLCLSAIDELIIKNAPRDTQSLLDVGAGDGRRGMNLAKRLKIEKIILVDPSLEMVKKCKILQPTDIWHLAAEDLPSCREKFDIILCLWNVLGHINNRSRRIKALKRMKENLSPNGRIFLDVNNRHNASSYGWLKVFGRILIDAILPDEKRGDASFNWEIGGKTFSGMGHLFTPFEIENIIKESGLTIEKRYAINYKNGRIGRTFLEGQLFYILEK